MKQSIILSALLLGACQPGPQDNRAANDSLANAGSSAPAGAANAQMPAELPAGDASAADHAGHAGTGPSPSPGPGPTPPPNRSDCPIVSSSDWAAFVNAMPGPNARPKLIVTGKVRTPTGGYTVGLRLGPVAESHPVQVTVRLHATPPDGPASQAIVTHDVRGSWPMSPPVGSVTIRCGSQVVKRISPVETAL